MASIDIEAKSKSEYRARLKVWFSGLMAGIWLVIALFAGRLLLSLTFMLQHSTFYWTPKFAASYSIAFFLCFATFFVGLFWFCQHIPRRNED